MTDIYTMILNELYERGCAHVAKFPPFFNCSIGCHIFNLYNKKNFVYFESGRVPDLRLHIMMVAPPGFSKTFWLEQYLDGVQAILKDSGIDIGFEGIMSEAGFVGTIRFVDGEPIIVQGMAKLYDKAIVGIEEFSALTEMMKQQHAKLLDSALLGALDSGRVRKRLAAGDVKYETNLTLWCGTQPARFDLTSGLGRRFLFLEFIPTRTDFQLLKIARRRSKNIAFNPIRTQRIRGEIKRLLKEVEKIKKVEFDPKVFKFFDKLEIIHYEEMLMERLLIGYHIMRGRFGKTLTVTLDDIAKQLVIRAKRFRDSIRRGSEFSEVLQILREHGGKMYLTDLKERLLYYGKDWSQSTQIIQEMLRMRAIRLRGEYVELSPSLR